MRTSVITAIYGDFDEVPPVPAGFDEAVLVSDKPVKSSWRNVVHPLPIPNRLAAKLPKFRPDLFVKNECSVWLDAACRDPSAWLSHTAGELLSQNDLWAFRHPDRQCIYAEAEKCKDWKKYRDWPIDRQILKYKNEGYPVNGGLWACGVIMRRHSDSIKRFGDEWYLENSMYSIQDQISFPYLLWRSGLKCHPLPGSICDDKLEFVSHKKRESDRLHTKVAVRLRRAFTRTLRPSVDG